MPKRTTRSDTTLPTSPDDVYLVSYTLQIALSEIRLLLITPLDRWMHFGYRQRKFIWSLTLLARLVRDFPSFETSVMEGRGGVDCWSYSAGTCPILPEGRQVGTRMQSPSNLYRMLYARCRSPAGACSICLESWFGWPATLRFCTYIM